MKHKVILLVVIFLLMIAPVSQCKPPADGQSQDSQSENDVVDDAPDAEVKDDAPDAEVKDDPPDADNNDGETGDEETEAQTGTIRLYDRHGALMLEVDWMMDTLHPAATNDDLEKVVFVSDPKGDKKYSDLSKPAGVDVPQNEIVGWGYMIMSDFLPGGLPPDEVFPCDEDLSPDAEWHTICMDDRPNNPWGDYYVIYTIHDGPILLQDQTYYHSHSVAFDSDGLTINNFLHHEPWDGDYYRETDRQFEAWYNLDQGEWMGNSMGPQFSVVPSDARFVIKGNTVFTLIPTSDFSVHDPLGRVTTFLTTGGFDPEDCGYDTNGEDPIDNLVPFVADPIYILDDQAMLAVIILDEEHQVVGPGCTLAQKPVEGGQKTMLWCLDNGCKGNGGACKLFNRLIGDPPQVPDSWNYVADGDQKMQKVAGFEYHCFCVK